MNKTRNFFKNYKKIIISVLIALVLIMAVVSIVQILTSINSIEQTNKAQMLEIAEANDWLDKYYDAIFDELYGFCDFCTEKLAKLISLEPSDVKNTDLLDSYSESDMACFMITDEDRNIIYSNGCEATDMKEEKYDSLFSGDELEGNRLEVEEEGTIFFSYKAGNYYVIGAVYRFDASEFAYNDREYWENVFADIWIEDGSFVAVVDRASNKIIYCERQELEGCPVDLDTINSSLISEIGNLKVCGKAYYINNDDLAFLILNSFSEIVGDSINNVLIEEALFLIVSIILICFIVFLRDDELDPGQEISRVGKFFLKTQLKRFGALSTCLGLLVVFIVIIAISMNSLISSQSILSEKSENVVDTIEGYYSDTTAMEALEDNEQFWCADIVSKFLDEHEEYVNKSGLTMLSDCLKLRGITIFDENGLTEATSTALDHLDILADEESTIYALRYVLMGKEQLKVEADPNFMEESEIMYAVPHRNAEGIADGIAAIIPSEYYETGEDLSDYLYSGRTESGIQIVVADKEGTILLASDDDKTGESVGAMGISQDCLVDDYFGRIESNGKYYAFFVNKISVDDAYVILLAPFQWITTTSIRRAIIVLILYILLVLWMIYDGLGSKYHFSKRESKIKDADDWENTRVGWEYYDANKKLGTVFKICIYLFSIYLIILKLFYAKGAEDGLGLSYIVSGEWPKTFNLFSIIGNICLVCVTVSGISWVKALLHVVSKTSGQGGETACRLIASIVKYAGAILCFYVCATNFGINAGAALASIGIVGFGLTFGAQDIIKDVIAGVFILFEGNYKVGDMLLIGSDWYWVKSIGVRTTQVEAWGSIKIINNSQMAGVVNIQNSTACVNCDICIANEYDIEEVEKILDKELPGLKGKLSAEVSTPVYKGVQGYNGNGTLIRIRSYCPPLYQGWVGRTLNREVKLILEKNNIKVPADSLNIHVSEMSKEEIISDVKCGR